MPDLDSYHDKEKTEVEKPRAEVIDQLSDLNEQYGFEIDPESVPRLLEQHELNTKYE